MARLAQQPGYSYFRPPCAPRRDPNRWRFIRDSRASTSHTSEAVYKQFSTRLCECISFCADMQMHQDIKPSNQSFHLSLGITAPRSEGLSGW